MTIKPGPAAAALKFKLAWIKSACRYVTQYIMLSNGYHQLLIKQSSHKIVSVNRIIVQKSPEQSELSRPCASPCRQYHACGECRQPITHTVSIISRSQRQSHQLTLTPDFPVKLPLSFITAPLILSPMDGLRRCVAMPFERPVVAGPWAPVLVPFVDASGPRPP